MTCIERYIQEHEFPVRGCPHEYGYVREQPKDCYCISCFKDCWARETHDVKGETKPCT